MSLLFNRAEQNKILRAAAVLVLSSMTLSAIGTQNAIAQNNDKPEATAPVTPPVASTPPVVAPGSTAPVTPPVVTPPGGAPPASRWRPGRNNRGDGRRNEMRNNNRRGDRPGGGGLQERERKLRQLMTSFGTADTMVQDEVIRFIGEDVRARQSLRRVTMQLYEAARNPAIDDAQLGQLLTQYQAAVEADRVRRERDEAALDEKIHYKSNPRLETMLLMFGVLGDRTMLIPMGPGRDSNRLPRFNQNGANQNNNREPQRGETTGILVAKRENEIDIRQGIDGPLETYRLRRENGAWDPAATAVLAGLKEGDSVTIRWVLREGKRIIEIQKAP